MGWTLTEPVSGMTVPVVPGSGTISITHDRASAVLWPLRGTAPFVQSGPMRLPAITTPPLVFDSKTVWQSFVTMAGLGRRMVLTDDMGSTWPVRIDGPVTSSLQDTADRASRPRYEVAVKFVGVA